MQPPPPPATPPYVGFKVEHGDDVFALRIATPLTVAGVRDAVATRVPPPFALYVLDGEEGDGEWVVLDADFLLEEAVASNTETKPRLRATSESGGG